MLLFPSCFPVLCIFMMFDKFTLTYSTIDDAGGILDDKTSSLSNWYAFFFILFYKICIRNHASFCYSPFVYSTCIFLPRLCLPSIGFHSQLMELVIMCIWTAASKHVNKSSSDTFDSSFIPQFLKVFVWKLSKHVNMNMITKFISKFNGSILIATLLAKTTSIKIHALLNFDNLMLLFVFIICICYLQTFIVGFLSLQIQSNPTTVSK